MSKVAIFHQSPLWGQEHDKTFVHRETPVTEEVLNVNRPSSDKEPDLCCWDGFFKKLTMCISCISPFFWLRKGYEKEGARLAGSSQAIETRPVLWKRPQHLSAGKTTLHTTAKHPPIRDCRTQRLSPRPTIFTDTQSPADVCATLNLHAPFNRVVIGDVTNASGNEHNDPSERRAG